MKKRGGSDNGSNHDKTPKSLGLPKIDLTNTPGWGSALGTMIGTRFGKNGAEVGFAVGHVIENFDWDWYREYRKVAQEFEDEYSGGLH